MADEKKSTAKKASTRKTVAKKRAATKTEAKQASAEKATAKKDAGTKKDAGKRSAPAAKKESRKAVPIVVRASSRYVQVAPRKARLVANQVRGLHIDQARALLEFSPRGVARNIQKLVESAAANAENNHELVADEMRIAEIKVDEGPTLKRFRPRAQGRATPIHKRTCHIAVALSPEEEA